MQVPSIDQAEAILDESAGRNPGPWVDHSKRVAQAARILAERLPGLEPDAACAMGCLHDVGRRFGVSHMRHAVEGHRYMNDLGFPDVARVCLTHSFPYPDIRCYLGEWDCSEEDAAFVRDYLTAEPYSDYDRLIQLCDALSLPQGFCLLEKRMVEVALRYGVNEYTARKWEWTLKAQRHFEDALGQSIYRFLPGVVANTFGCETP